MKYEYTYPLGQLLLTSDPSGLTGLAYEENKHLEDTNKEITPVIARTKDWLNQYFNGMIPDFLPDMHLKGTDFQKKVWNEIMHIPYGTTITYKQLAESISPSMSAQAVGHALSLNPIMIIIPCHRVIGSDGSLCGYAGGIDKKKWLLEWERNHLTHNMLR